MLPDYDSWAEDWADEISTTVASQLDAQNVASEGVDWGGTQDGEKEKSCDDSSVCSMDTWG